ncbi:MAG TPA: DNA alkylation repair protein [Thermodesulfovibrionales bacterium]|nr:DNA alkylation repair protein [Thermodesulfovibrionales bacterium]
MVRNLKEDLRKLADPERARILSRFFKTGKGEYGEGDVFLGITVPQQRRLAKMYPDLSLEDIGKLLWSKAHEERLVSLFILITQYRRSDRVGKEEILNFYLRNTKRINNWDLVDASAGPILGDYLTDRDRSVLVKLARSTDLWERRIAIMATFAFIKDNDFGDTLRIAELLLRDGHDLIHKAVGWMLREVGKRDREKEKEFLERHCHEMPRTMLRYAIERFGEKERKDYLNKYRGGKSVTKVRAT